MRKICLPFLIGLTVLLCSSAAFAQLSATVDRNQIALDETVNLTITKEGISSVDAADLQPLEHDFRIVGQSQSSNAQYINGSLSSFFTLNLVLAPKRAGNLQIPPLSIGKEKTAPLAVKVVTQAQPKTRADNTPIYLETEVDAKEVFVQSQLIYTLRIFWAVEASINDPGDPQLKDALVERLNDATFDKVIAGQSYKVFERKFAIFPQKSGILEIPQIVVQATVPDRQQRHNNFYGFFGTRGREIKLRSEGVTITVKGKMAEYPAGAEWLPTSKLSLAEEWSLDPDQLQVGESATITIAMAAQGMQGAQLPPIALPETDGIKLYQGKAEVQNLINADGITGIRKESIALIPIQAGKMVLPEIRIPWWNIKQQRVEYAVIPARNLEVENVPGKSATSGAVAPPAIDYPEQPFPEPARVSPAGEEAFNKLLLAFCLFLLAGWLVTTFFLLQARKRMAAFSGDRLRDYGNSDDNNEEEAFRKFSQACRSNDPGRARKEALDWVRVLRPKERVQTVADIERLYPNSNLVVLLEEIDSLLYSGGETVIAWRGKGLLEEAEKIRKTGGREKVSALQELYR